MPGTYVVVSECILSICKQYFSAVIVLPGFRKLWWTTCRPSNTHYNLLLMQCRLRLGLWLLIVDPTTAPNVAGCHKGPTFYRTLQFVAKKIVFVAQNELIEPFFVFPIPLNGEKWLIGQRWALQKPLVLFCKDRLITRLYAV